MKRSRETSWTLVRGAAAGEEDERRRFARIYLPVVRAYLGARWRGRSLSAELEDAVQDTFLDCFRENGALARLRGDGRSRFRTFLYGVVRNVALRYEERSVRDGRRQGADVERLDPPADDERLSAVFDRAWARALLRRAAARQLSAAREKGEGALRRVEILDLRFRQGLPIREIARLWGIAPEKVHHWYARARNEYRRCLREEVAEHHPGTPGEVDRACAALLSYFA